MKRQPTPQHLTWFLDLYGSKQLILDPPYQRKSVWSPKDKRFFIDTIFRNYPTPPIFVHREISDIGVSTYNVVDGKQRLETIIEFATNKFAVDKEFGDANLDGKKFKDLSIEYKRMFWNYILVVDFIESIEGKNIEEVFDRVNRNAKNLQPQELRHAKYDGWFIQEVENESDQPFWWDLKVSTKAKDKRMKNDQFISELLLVLLEGDIVGFSQEYLDRMYANYDVPEDTTANFDKDTYLLKKERIKDYIKLMNEANSCIDIFGKTSNNLYTLWAFLAVNIDNLPEPVELGHQYYNFMSHVQEFINANAPDDVNTSPEEVIYYTYYLNSKGAATELPQRRARLEALSTILH